MCSAPAGDGSLNLLDNGLPATTTTKKWVETVSVPLMMAYITRYIIVSVALFCLFTVGETKAESRPLRLKVLN